MALLTRNLRLLGLIVAIVLTPLWATAQAQSPSVPVFAHVNSDLPPDPNAHFGKLSNGLTYVIYPNRAEAGKVTMRLRIQAGSLDEGDAENGIANLITFMAFTGSTRYPEGDMFRKLERQGIKMGPGPEAWASPVDTHYVVNLPRNDAAALETGFGVLSDIATGLTFPEAAMQRERDLVVSQMVNQNRATKRNFEDWLRAIFAGQALPERPVLGQRDIVLYTPREAIVGFYDSYYRPELTTLIIVGDVDVKAMEKRIKAQFGNWKPRSKTLKARNAGNYVVKGARTRTYFEPGLAESIDLMWAHPYDPRYQTRELAKVSMLDVLILRAINARLEKVTSQPESAVIHGRPTLSRFSETGEIVGVSFTPKPGQARAAMGEIVPLLRQIEVHGFTETERRTVIADYESRLKESAAGSSTRSNAQIADMMAQSLDYRFVINSPEQDLSFYQSFIPELTLEVMNARARELLTGDGPLISLTGPAATAYDQKAVEAHYAELSRADVPAPIVLEAKVWPYTQFGTPVAPKTMTYDEALAVTRLTYPNGVRVNIKTTPYKAGEVVVMVRSLGGLKRLSATTTAPVFAANFYNIYEGGLKGLSAAEINDALAGKTYGLNFMLGEDAAALYGFAPPEDFSTQMQVLRAFYSEAAFDPTYLNRLRGYAPSIFNHFNASPKGVMELQLPRLVFDNDARKTPMSQTEFAAVNNDAVATLIRDSLKDAPVEITIVGNITVEQARPALDATFGTLPPVAKTVTETGPTARFPTHGLERTLYHQGSPEQALIVIAFPTTDKYADPKTTVGLDLLAEIISLRHYETVRAQAGTTYVPLARAFPSEAFAGFGYLSAIAHIYPGYESEFYDEFVSLTDGLKAEPVTEDEILRARQGLLSRLDAEVRTNGYWANLITNLDATPGRADYALNRKAYLESLTPKDIQELAKTYLNERKALKVIVLPLPREESKAS